MYDSLYWFLIDLDFLEINLPKCIWNRYACRDFSRNYLNGSLPREWGASRLTNMYVIFALHPIVSSSCVWFKGMQRNIAPLKFKGKRKDVKAEWILMWDCRFSMTSFVKKMSHRNKSFLGKCEGSSSSLSRMNRMKKWMKIMNTYHFIYISVPTQFHSFWPNGA